MVSIKAGFDVLLPKTAHDLSNALTDMSMILPLLFFWIPVASHKFIGVHRCTFFLEMNKWRTRRKQ